METLFGNLGLDWKLLLSQAANFFILLVVLRLTIYKPLLGLLEKRRKAIETGLERAKEAERRMAEIGNIQNEKMKEAEAQALALLRKTEKNAKALEQKTLLGALEKEAEILKRAEAKAEAEKKASIAQVEREAVHLVKKVLTTAVSLKPEAVDEVLIERAVQESRSQ